MPAIAITTTIASKHHRQTAKGLIAAHNAAVEAEQIADTAAQAIWYGNHSIYIPEIGPNCHVSTVAELNEKISGHIANHGDGGYVIVEFRQRMVLYRAALEALAKAALADRERVGAEETEKRAQAAGRASTAAWKALLAYAKCHPKDAAEIATHGANLNQGWEAAELLRAIATAGKAVRS